MGNTPGQVYTRAMNTPVTRMRAEILSIGTELLLGETVDTNATFLASSLRDHGIDLYFKSTVGDNRGRLLDTLKYAFERSDLVITTGGLGPTPGDLTRETIAEFVGETPVEDPVLLAELEALFASRNRQMPARNRKQAWLIPSAETLPNPVGTAPGWLVRHRGRIIVALPGPPHEMRRMWESQALPRLPLPTAGLFTTTLHTFNLGESHLIELLGDLPVQANPTVATYARRHGVDVRVAAGADSAEEAEMLARPVVERILATLGEHVYGRDEQSLADVVGERLKAKSARLWVGDRYSGGSLLELICGARSHPSWFVDGRLETCSSPWTEEQCRSLLPREPDRERGVFVLALAPLSDGTGAQIELYRFGPDAWEKPVTAVWRWPGDPDQMKIRAAHSALYLLWKTLS